MIDPAAMIRAIDDAQQTYALEFLSKPSGQDAFALGRANGVVLGLGHARKLIIDALSDDEEEGKAL